MIANGKFVAANAFSFATDAFSQLSSPRKTVMFSSNATSREKPFSRSRAVARRTVCFCSMFSDSAEAISDT